MKIWERIRDAETSFYSKFEQGTDEWSEMFEYACRFAIRLSDSPKDKDLLNSVMTWIEEASKYEPPEDYYE